MLHSAPDSEVAVTCVESANAFAIEEDKAEAIASCVSCGRAIPIGVGPAISEISDAMASAGFSVTKLIVEAAGRRRDCQQLFRNGPVT